MYGMHLMALPAHGDAGLRHFEKIQRERMLDEAVRRAFARFDAIASTGFHGSREWGKWCLGQGPVTFESFAQGYAHSIRAEFLRLHAEAAT